MKRLFMSFSHEFSTSLNCILTVAQAAYDEQSFPANIRNDFFLPIIKSGKILHSIVSDMIDYNHMLGKSFQLCLAPFYVTFQKTYYQQIKELIEEVLHLFSNQIKEKGVQITLDFSDRIVNYEIISDKQRIRQILINLLSNAQKFTFSGQISLTVSMVQLAGKNRIKFIVEDSGIGMKQEEQERLTQLLESSTCPDHQISSNTAGFGLGLFISSRIAETLSKIHKNQGGGIQFESKLSKGSKFWFHVTNQSALKLESKLPDYSQNPFIIVDKNNVLDLKKSDVSYFLNVNLSQLMKSSRRRETSEVKEELDFIIQNKKLDFLLSENEQIEESLRDVMSVKQADLSEMLEQFKNDLNDGEINSEFDAKDQSQKLILYFIDN